MQSIASETLFIDLEHTGQPRAIGACLLDCGGTLALIDPGPGSTLGTLRSKLKSRGATVRDIGAILLTHIHLDHAGATGSLVGLNPAIRVFVHQRGARHMIDPERLLRSATRLYGDDMDRLWGEFLAVPEANVHSLGGGEQLSVGDRTFEVAYTPGHASHHVSYFERTRAIAYTGDVAGCCISGTSFVIPPTPPPDIHVPDWLQSLEKIRNWQPERLVLTHFGAVTAIAAHLDALAERLQRWSSLVGKGLAAGGDDADLIEAFRTRVVEEFRAGLDDAAAQALMHAAPPDTYWAGLSRYWRKFETP